MKAKKAIDTATKEVQEINLMHYSGLIDRIALAYSRRYEIHPFTTDDLQQEVKMLMLERLESIQRSYRGEASISHFLVVVIRNTCREISRRKKLGNFRETKLEEKDRAKLKTSGFSTDGQVYIQEEVRRLEMIFSLYGVVLPRIRLAFKGFFRLEIFSIDIKRYISGYQVNVMVDAFVHLLNSEKKSTDKEVFKKLTQLFNTVEEKQNTTEAVRKWTLRKSQEVIELLNGRDRNRFYSRESFKVLFELYSEEERKEPFSS